MIRSNRTHESSVALFLLGALLLLPPLLQVFNRPERLWGFPVLYLYVFLAWAVLIALAAAIARRASRDFADSATASAAAAGRVPGAAEGAENA